MKQKIMTVLAVPVLFGLHIATANAITEVSECGTRGTCTTYNKDTYRQITGDIVSGITNETTCISNNNCWDLSLNLCFINISDHDLYGYCGDNCTNMGYDVAVIGTPTTPRVGCACYPDVWETYGSGALRKYTYTRGSGSNGCTKTATSEYKCATTHYGSAPTSCMACPANATCSGGTSFNCNDGYYRNDAKTGCNKCPDSKTGGLGWNTSGNGVAGEYGADSITGCFIAEGTKLQDATGSFILVGSDCNYVE